MWSIHPFCSHIQQYYNHIYKVFGNKVGLAKAVFDLVIERGWTAERYGRWIAAAITAAVLP